MTKAADDIGELSLRICRKLRPSVEYHSGRNLNTHLVWQVETPKYSDLTRPATHCTQHSHLVLENKEPTQQTGTKNTQEQKHLGELTGPKRTTGLAIPTSARQLIHWGKLLEGRHPLPILTCNLALYCLLGTWKNCIWTNGGEIC